MNGGVISSRYAKALLLLVQQDGRGQEVFAQARALLKDPTRVPEPLEPGLARLVMLLRSNGRGGYLRQILVDFVRLYASSSGAKLAHLTVAAPSPGLEERLSALIGGTVFMDTEVDPSIEGGFILTVDDLSLDASVRGQLEKIRREFIAKNQRIV